MSLIKITSNWDGRAIYNYIIIIIIIIFFFKKKSLILVYIKMQ